MAGYKTEQFVDKIDDNLLCPICKDVLRDPVMNCKEGHTFCRYCIKQWMRSVDRCPLDNSLIEDRNCSRNLALTGVIENLNVYCHPQGEGENQESTSFDVGSITVDISAHKSWEIYNRCRDNGASTPGCKDAVQKCSWVGKLESLAKHQQTCPFQLVPCPHEKCIFKTQRRQIKEHENTCGYKRVACDGKCGLVLVQHELQNHKMHKCPETLIPCPYECTNVEGLVNKIKRMNLDKHLATVCGKALVDCPFKDRGCSVQVERQKIDMHVQDSVMVHLSLVENQNTLLKDELSEVKQKSRYKSFGSYLWKIYDYQSLAKTKGKGTSFTSPMFIQCGHRWMLELFPNGSSISGFGMIVLRLYWIGDEEGKQYEDYKVSAAARLEVLSVKQGNKDHLVKRNIIFKKTNDYWEWDRFMRSNVALSRTYCDSSTGILQIQCTIQIEGLE